MTTSPHFSSNKSMANDAASARLSILRLEALLILVNLCPLQIVGLSPVSWVGGSPTIKQDLSSINTLGYPKPTSIWASHKSSPYLSSSSSANESVNGSNRAIPSASSNSISEAASHAPRQPETDKRASGDKSRGVNHLSYHEMMDRKAKGLCFRCRKKFHPLKLILGDDETIDDSGNLMAIEVDEAVDDDPLECNVMELFGMASSSFTEGKP